MDPLSGIARKLFGQAPAPVAAGELARAGRAAMSDIGTDSVSPVSTVGRTEILSRFNRVPTSMEFRNFTDGVRYVIPSPSSSAVASFGGNLPVLDRLATALRYADGQIGVLKKVGLGQQDLNLGSYRIAVGNKVAKIQKVGAGSLGHVYSVELEGKRYALKVFADPERIDTHGWHAETGLLSYATAHDARGIVHIHAASPQGGWYLSDFANESTLLTHAKGPHVSKLLNDAGLVSTDDVAWNSAAGTILDAGGYQRQIGSVSTLKEFEALYADPLSAAVAGRSIRSLPPNLRQQAFTIALAHPESRSQAIRALRDYRGTDFSRQVLEAALDLPESRGRAATILPAMLPLMPKRL